MWVIPFYYCGCVLLMAEIETDWYCNDRRKAEERLAYDDINECPPSGMKWSMSMPWEAVMSNNP